MKPGTLEEAALSVLENNQDISFKLKSIAKSLTDHSIKYESCETDLGVQATRALPNGSFV